MVAPSGERGRDVLAASGVVAVNTSRVAVNLDDPPVRAVPALPRYRTVQVSLTLRKVFSV